MPAGTIPHQHRHFKTLIVLVLAMTGGTILLYWIAQIAPITPLRGTAAASGPWTRIAVRAQVAGTPHGFFHYRIDQTGRLFQSYAWLSGQHSRRSPDAIHILLTCPDRDLRISPAQARELSRLISKLRREHGIPQTRVSVESARGVAFPRQNHRRLRRT